MNKRPYNLDLMHTDKLVDLFLNEEEKTLKALKKEKANISKTINQIINKIKRLKQPLHGLAMSLIFQLHLHPI